MLGSFWKEQIKDKSINITLDDEALDYLVDKGYDPKMGARPLQRVIDKEIKKPLSRAMLFGNLKKGGDCKIIVKDGILQLSFDKVKIEEKNHN